AKNPIRSRQSGLVLGATLCALLWGLRTSGQDRGAFAARFGGPLPGISAQEFEQFRVGMEDFLEVEEPEDGLGPVFNGRSCAECHSIPAVGGSGIILEMRAGRRDADGNFDPLPGGSVFQLFSIPPHTCQEQIPPDANVVAPRKSIPLFGAGLVDAIPDQALAALADPDDRDRDGGSGRVHWVTDPATGATRAGRFGWKAQQATLLSFCAEAYLEEMGITNQIFPSENAPNGDGERLLRCLPVRTVRGIEDVPDRFTGLRGIDNFEAFLRFLAPPPRGEIAELAQRGERVFAEIGCASCHVPALVTGANSSPAFDRRPVRLFSDLLLHDIGTGDGIAQGDALGEEIRTPALWGLRVRRGLLHDGSAATPTEAILRHEQESAEARRRFQALSAEDATALLAFLDSL
ncbi:MAG: di-heme oxidoredictase family protein, partial [Terriglobia bacterium]